MAAGKYTLLDLAVRNGVGVQSLIEGVLTYAPEFEIIPTFPKSGITYTTLTRTALPSGDFRNVGEGVGLQKSEWKRETGSMALFEAQMQIAEDIMIAAMAENSDLKVGDLLTDEGMATVRGSVIKICSQFWYGKSISAKGFAGLSTQVDTANNEISAGGADGADSSSVYLVIMSDGPTNPQGVNFVLGNGGKMSLGEQWIKQQIKVSTNPDTFAMGFANNFLSYLGLQLNRPQALYRVKNVTAANPFTDAIAADLLAQKVPLALQANKANMRWFMNASARGGLRKSRATVTINGKQGAAGAYPEVPTTCEDIAIIPTDSLRKTDRAGLYN